MALSSGTDQDSSTAVKRRLRAKTGERLAELVEPMGPEEPGHVGDAVVDSRTGEELLERASNGVSSKPLN